MELLGLWTWRACTPYIVAEHKHLQLRWTSLSLGLLGPKWPRPPFGIFCLLLGFGAKCSRMRDNVKGWPPIRPGRACLTMPLHHRSWFEAELWL